MKLDGIVPPTATSPALSGPGTPAPRSREEAARQFEMTLAKQFVKTMTDGLFKNPLGGDDGPGWIEGQYDTQRDLLTQTLAEHLTEDGTLGIADLLMRQWSRNDAAAELAEQLPAAEPTALRLKTPEAPRPLTTPDALPLNPPTSDPDEL